MYAPIGVSNASSAPFSLNLSTLQRRDIPATGYAYRILSSAPQGIELRLWVVLHYDCDVVPQSTHCVMWGAEQIVLEPFAAAAGCAVVCVERGGRNVGSAGRLDSKPPCTRLHTSCCTSFCAWEGLSCHRLRLRRVPLATGSCAKARGRYQGWCPDRFSL